MDKYISLKDCLKELNKDEYSLPIILGKDSNNDIHIKDLVDLKEFFKENKFEEANWESVTNVMLEDKDVNMNIKEEIIKITKI